MGCFTVFLRGFNVGLRGVSNWLRVLFACGSLKSVGFWICWLLLGLVFACGFVVWLEFGIVCWLCLMIRSGFGCCLDGVLYGYFAVWMLLVTVVFVFLRRFCGCCGVLRFGPFLV